MKRATLTIAILAKNEEQMISRAIASSTFADEVLMLDGGSTDRTIEIAEHAGARVIERPFDDFAHQRNYALEAARGDWVLFVDADERVSKELAAEIRKLLRRHPDADAYAVPRKNMALGRWLEWHLGGAVDAPVRLMRRGGPRWSGSVHEVVEGASHIGALSSPLWHLTHRSVSEVVRKIDYYSDFQADERLARGARAPAAKDILASFQRTLDDLWKSGLKKEGDVGAVEAALLAFNETLVLAKVWEKTRAEPLDEAYRRADAELELPEAEIIDLPESGA